MPQGGDVPDTPDKLFLELPRRKIPSVLPHQSDILKLYSEEAITAKDVALQLPTGSGKTLVGLLIAEWRRRKNKERVVYLCPTNQLVNQVVEQAEEIYGLSVNGFTGSAASYSPQSKAEYQHAEKIAITNYSSLFNSNPYFKNADVIILDDAHASEGYIASNWSVLLDRTNHKDRALHTAICNILKNKLSPDIFLRITGEVDDIRDRGWVDKLPTPVFNRLIADLTPIFNAHINDTDQSYSWSMINAHLPACHLYLSPTEILIRPLIPPTWMHEPFTKPAQRIYMSATLGAGGDLERLTGRKSIKRLAIPKGWDRQGVGRRLFVFPEMSLDTEENKQFRLDAMERAKRSLVLVPNNHLANQIAREVEAELKYPIFTSDDIEQSKKPFVKSKNAVAIIANRYDGIDFPDTECRVMFIEGLPKVTNIQERFIHTRMGAFALFNERIQTRVLQAIGRCTRSLNDYSAVIVSGEELPTYLIDAKRRKYLHPELQAEIAFGIEQSKDQKHDVMLKILDVFLKNDKAWEGANSDILSHKKTLIREPFPLMDELANVVVDEIKYQVELWRGDYVTALEFAEKVIEGLKGKDLIGYRALWHYLAGSAAYLAVIADKSNNTYKAKVRKHFDDAKKRTVSISWLVGLAKFDKDTGSSEKIADKYAPQQVDMIEVTLEQFGLNDQKYAKHEKQIIDGLSSTNYKVFEEAHRLLGELLGFRAGNDESQGAPDPWWIIDDVCLVFEDHSDATKVTVLDITKARQVHSHPNWIRANSDIKLPPNSQIWPVLLSPIAKAKKAAKPHLDGVLFWNKDEFVKWATDALQVIRVLRKTYSEPGNQEWRSMVIEELREKKLDALSIMDFLKGMPATKSLRFEGD